MNSQESLNFINTKDQLCHKQFQQVCKGTAAYGSIAGASTLGLVLSNDPNIYFILGGLIILGISIKGIVYYFKDNNRVS